MTSFKLAPIVPIAIIIVLALILWFVALPMIGGLTKDNTPQTNVQGYVIQKTISGTGGTLFIVDAVNQNTVSLTVTNNQMFNAIEQYKQYSFIVRGQGVMSYEAI